MKFSGLKCFAKLCQNFQGFKLSVQLPANIAELYPVGMDFDLWHYQLEERNSEKTNLSLSAISRHGDSDAP